MSMSEPSGTDGGELPAVVSKLRGAGRQDPLSSSESPQVAGSSAMAGLRLLVIAAVLTEVASKWIITVEKADEDHGHKVRFMVCAALILVLALCVLRKHRWIAKLSDEPSQAVRTLKVDEDDWSVVEETAEECKQVASGQSSREVVYSDPKDSGLQGSGLRSRRGGAAEKTGLRQWAASSSSNLVSSGVGEQSAPILRGQENPGVQQEGFSASPRAYSGVGERDTPTSVEMPGASSSGLGEELAPWASATEAASTGVRETVAQETAAVLGEEVRFEECRIHPAWKIKVPPRHMWPEPHQWAGVQGNWHQPIPTYAKQDAFFWDETRQVLVRFHPKVRTHRFDPQRAVLPAQVPLSRLSGCRRTYAKYTDGRKTIEEDNFFEGGSSRLDGNWTGRTEFQVLGR